MIAWLLVPVVNSPAQPDSTSEFDLPSIVHQLESNQTAEFEFSPWWNRYVSLPQRKNLQATNVDIESLLLLALQNSNAIQIAYAEPAIRRAAIEEVDSTFDWNHYLDTTWADTSEPTGSSLTAGDGIMQFNDHQLSGESGLRRQTRTGGQLSIGQRFGWQDNNSDFLTPPNQANSRLTLAYTHPLLRGRGRVYNSSIVVLAKVDAMIANKRFQVDLENHLLDVVQTYWSMYRERAALAQQVRLLIKTKALVDVLAARQQFDTQRTQYVSAKAALEARKSTLLQTKLAVSNQEGRLRGLINAAELGQTEQTELVPQTTPSAESFPIDIEQQLKTAVVSRPEAIVGMQQIQNALTRIGVARHEILPTLNLVTQGYLSGLQGDADFAESFADQFSEGAPSYSVGLNYALPLGNRAANSRLYQRRIELERLQREYQQTLQVIRSDVDLAVNQIRTAWGEINASSRALKAAEAESETLRLRWDGMMDRGQNSGLNLEALLRAQERVTDLEQQYLVAVISYNMATIQLKRANGTLLQSEWLGDLAINNTTIESTADSQLPFSNSDDENAPPIPMETSTDATPVNTNPSNESPPHSAHEPRLRQPGLPWALASTQQPQPKQEHAGDGSRQPIEQDQSGLRDERFAELPPNFRAAPRQFSKREFTFPGAYAQQPAFIHAKPFPIIPQRPLSTAGFGKPDRRYR